MGNKILDILSKAAEDAVDAAEAKKQKKITDSKPTMINLPPISMSPHGYAPIPNSFRPPVTEQKTRVGLSPIQADMSLEDVQTIHPNDFVMEDDKTSEADVLHFEDANAVDDVDFTLPDASADIEIDPNIDPNMDISLDIDVIDDVNDETIGISQADAASQQLISELQQEIARLNVELEETQSKLAASETRVLQIQEKLIRTTADFDNYRKRTNRDQEQYKTQAEERIVNDFLAVQDNFERAIQHVQTANDFDSLMHGVKLTNKMYTAALAKHGCVSFDSLGKPFDPNYHDVLSRVEDDTVPNNTIVQEHLKGYMMRDHLLRPALVVVAQNSTYSSQTAPAVTRSQESQDSDNTLSTSTPETH